jgi:hypothetical protein
VSQGENISNYQNAEFDRLYAIVQSQDDGPAKQAAIDRMTEIVQQDAPWSFGYFPWSALAFQPWVHNGKPSILIRDMAKYYRVDTAMRATRQAEWNRPIVWPIVLLAMLPLALVLLAWRAFVRRERASARPVPAVT